MMKLNTDIHVIVKATNERGHDIMGVYANQAEAFAAIPDVFRAFVRDFAEGAEIPEDKLREDAEIVCDGPLYLFWWNGFKAELAAIPLFPDPLTAEGECHQMLGDILGFARPETPPTPPDALERCREAIRRDIDALHAAQGNDTP